MAYECKTLQIQGELPVCTEWQEASFLPELTGADRDVILQWAIYSPFLPELTDEARDELIKYVLKLLIGTFVVIKVVGLIKRT